MEKHATRDSAERFTARFELCLPRYATRRRLRAGCAAVVAVVLMLTLAPATAFGVDTGSIAGRVTDQTGAPLEGIQVAAIGTTFVSNVYTEADGRYLAADLPVGDYVVMWFGVPGGENRFYGGVASFEDATPVRVVVGEVTGGIDGELPPAPPPPPSGSIAGRVTDQTGAPLEGIEVTAYGTEAVSGAYTDADGRHEVVGLPVGDYVIRWWDPLLLYGGDIGYYDGVLLPEDATPVRVVVDEVTRGIDGVLLNPPAGDGSIAGRVTDQQGRPLEGICVSAENRVNGRDAEGA